MAVQELRMNKFRTFLSLFGITIGIFCIIGVLSSVNSLERNIQKDLSTIGNHTIFISKWSWTPSAGNYPWWTYANRPSVSTQDLAMLQQYNTLTQYACYMVSDNNNAVELNGNILSPVTLYATTPQFINVQNVTIGTGRYISNQEFEAGSNVCVLGYTNASKLFGSATAALEQRISIRGHYATVIGVLKAYGKNILDGWDYDNSVLLAHNYYQKYYSNRKAEPFIMAKPYNKVSTEVYLANLTSTMHAIRKIKPGAVPNYSLNDINIFADRISGVTKYVQLGGSVIALFSLVVGAFGIANIMFVTVKERTKIIGLKKAIGAKGSTIKLEFLMESAFLSIAGGFIGLLLLYLCTLLLSKVLHFNIIIQYTEVLITIAICTVLGIISGYIPANKAANMNVVTALRTT